MITNFINFNENKVWDLFKKKYMNNSLVSKPTPKIDKWENYAPMPVKPYLYLFFTKYGYASENFLKYFREKIVGKRITINCNDSEKTFILKDIKLDRYSESYFFFELSDGENSYYVFPTDMINCKVWMKSYKEYKIIDPFGEEIWENADYTNIDPFGEENWTSDDERMLPRFAICIHGYDEFIEGERYEVMGGDGDPEGAIEAGYEYMPLSFMKDIDLTVNNKVVTIQVADFIENFEDTD